ncbi:MAG: hypothetical protein WAK82_31925, partial [Streptosporangiaceae bacterium]
MAIAPVPASCPPPLTMPCPLGAAPAAQGAGFEYGRAGEDGLPAPEKPELVPVGPGAQDGCIAPAFADGAGPLPEPLATGAVRGAVVAVVLVVA